MTHAPAGHDASMDDLEDLDPVMALWQLENDARTGKRAAPCLFSSDPEGS